MASHRLSPARLATLRKQQPWTEEDARLVVAELDRVGCSVAALCREHHLSAPRLYWWRTRLNSMDLPNDSDAEISFAPVVLTGRQDRVAVVVRVNEVAVEVVDPSMVDPAWLAAVLAATRSV